MPIHPLAVLLALFALLLAAPAGAQTGADTVLVNGRIVRFEAEPSEALAIRAGRIVALGTSREIRALAGPATRIIDLAGDMVIPGLIDSHIHAIRAGLTYQNEVDWSGARTIAEALSRLRAAALRAPQGAWLVVAGGWVARQFAEGRRPSQEEIVAAVPDHPVYVQLLYSAVLLSPGGLAALGVLDEPELASRLTVETDVGGNPTGWLSAESRTISELYDHLPRPGFAQQLAGTREFFRTLNSLGVTGVIDPGGYNLPLSAYQPLFRLWREEGLSLRVAYSLCAPRRGHELEDFQALTAALPMGLGDDSLRFNGIGENVVWGMYNNDAPSTEEQEQLFQVLRWAAARGLAATFHWNSERSVAHLLAVLARVNAETSLVPLRWSIAHLNDASLDSLRRMQALGIGWLVQDALYYSGEDFVARQGVEAARFVPPIVTALHLGLPVGAGTDAQRVMSFNPFVALQWLVDGRTVAGLAMRAPEQRLSRLAALKLYTLGSAWFAHDEERRGELEAGRLADLAVLDRDYLAVPVEEIAGIRALLTLVGGRVVHATGRYAGLLENGLRR